MRCGLLIRNLKNLKSTFYVHTLHLFNVDRPAEAYTKLHELPVVKNHLANNPRKQLPLRQRLTDDEAAIIIQKYARGYAVRKIPEVQELLDWQKSYRQCSE